MLRRTTVFPAQTAAFVMAETVLADQVQFTNAKRGGPAFQQATLTLQQPTLSPSSRNLESIPDIRGVGRAALPDRGGAAHGANNHR